MNRLNTLPDDILEYIYLINHKAYQNEINKILNKPQIMVFMDFHYLISIDDSACCNRDYIKELVFHLENTF